MNEDTFVWTPDDAGSHADMSMPVHRMKANVAGDERRVQVVKTFNVFVHVAAKILSLFVHQRLR